MEMAPMSDSQAHPDAQPTGAYLPSEPILERFQQAWEQGHRPAVGDFWPAEGVDRVALLSELVRIDLAQRLKTGESARADEYLQIYPELCADHSATLALINAEFEGRREREPNLTTEEYTHRFPAFREDLAAQVSGTENPLTVAGAPVPQSSQVIGPSGTMSEKSKPTIRPNPVGRASRATRSLGNWDAAAWASSTRRITSASAARSP
jgi:hypothetical protein